MLKYLQQLSLLDPKVYWRPKVVALVFLAFVLSIDFGFANIKIFLNSSFSSYITLWYPFILKICLFGIKQKGTRY